MKNIKVVRLQTGEELIGSVKEDGDMIFVDKAAIILPAGQGKIGLAPYMPYCDFDSTTLELQKRHVVFIVSPVEEFANQYNTSFGNGLVIPDAMTAAAINNAPSGAEDTGGLKLVTD